MELGYRLAVSEEPYIRQIRDNVIVSITPSTDVDGRDRYVDWYYAYKIDEPTTAARTMAVRRTGASTSSTTTIATSTTASTRCARISNWYLHWVPPIWHDLHEAQTLLYTFSGQPPQNANLDPILYTRAAVLRDLRSEQAHRLRHARRVALRLRRHVVARLSRLRRRQSQRHAADVRDLQSGRRQHEEGAALRARRRRGSGTGRIPRRRAKSTGRSATRSTTRRPAC